MTQHPDEYWQIEEDGTATRLRRIGLSRPCSLYLVVEVRKPIRKQGGVVTKGVWLLVYFALVYLAICVVRVVTQ